ncbi:MAG: LD-carboxypeptidase [Flavobacteriales bacterium]|nr:LD-carboxypeptidase [Flavobacteriales bacterium]
MIQPNYLKAGDHIRIISTARKISAEEIEASKSLFESWGLKVEYGENLFAEDDQFAGTEAQRTADLQAALDDESVKAIVFARGGYGSVQVLDRIDWSNFKMKPKWLVGYSDITVFHSYLNRAFGIESLHAPMPVNIKQDGSGLSKEAERDLHKALFGEQLNYNFQAHSFNTIQEDISGELVGGNLSILYSLSGSNAQLNGKGKIIFMEDLDEYLYHIDRMLMNLIRSDLFEGCVGVLIGGMSDMNDNTIPYGKTAEEIIAHRLGELNIPLVFGFPAGHIHDNRPLILGRKASISQNGNQMKLQFHERA